MNIRQSVTHTNNTQTSTNTKLTKINFSSKSVTIVTAWEAAMAPPTDSYYWPSGKCFTLKENYIVTPGPPPPLQLEEEGLGDTSHRILTAAVEYSRIYN